MEPQAPAQVSNQGYQPVVNKRSKSFSNAIRSYGIPILLVAILVFQVVNSLTLLYATNPDAFNVLGVMSPNDQIVNEIVSKAQTPDLDTSNVAIRQIADAESLRAENEIQAEVYANARNGDYAVAFVSNDIQIIYRDETDEVIYEGDTVSKIAETRELEIVNRIISNIEGAALATNLQPEQLQFSVVTSPAELREQDATFYANARRGDIVVSIPDEGLVVLYRQDGEQIVNHGKYQIAIR